MLSFCIIYARKGSCSCKQERIILCYVSQICQSGRDAALNLAALRHVRGTLPTPWRNRQLEQRKLRRTHDFERRLICPLRRQEPCGSTQAMRRMQQGSGETMKTGNTETQESDFMNESERYSVKCVR